jgi:PAS domain S-box-containing protein
MAEGTQKSLTSDLGAVDPSCSLGERINGPWDGRSDVGGEEDAKAWLAAIVESSDDAILSKTLEGIIISWNAGATRLFGFTAAEAIGQPIRILIPDDRQHEEDTILACIRRGERIEHFETVRRRKDGSLAEISLTVSPVRGEQGTIIGASKIARDISERKRHQEHQSLLLLREMNHRVKNLFMVAASLITLSERSADGAADLAEGLRGRMAALARAHALTMPELSGVDDERTTTLFALLEAILDPHKNGVETRTHIHGCDISIRGDALTSLALVLNEFTTNAAKYGCLSIQEGTLSIESVIDGEDLVLIWTEAGGPEVNAAVGEGFGSQLERAAIERSLHGSLSRDWAPSGLIIRARIPLSRLSDQT